MWPPAGHQDSATGTDASSEVPSVLDNILANPDIGLLAPEHMRASTTHDDDDPPPWQPLRIPHGVATSAATCDTSSDTAASSGISSVTQSGSQSAAARDLHQEGSLQSSAKHELDQTRADRHRQGVEQSAKPGPPRGQPGSPLLEADIQGGSSRREMLHKTKLGPSEGQHEFPLHRAESQGGSSSTSMQAARSQEGDFLRLLESQGPAPRRSLHESDLQQLPRSFSMSAKPKPAAAAAEPEGSGDEALNQSSSPGAYQQEAEMPAIMAQPEQQALGSLSVLDDGAEIPDEHQSEQTETGPDVPAAMENDAERAEVLLDGKTHCGVFRSLQQPESIMTLAECEAEQAEAGFQDIPSAAAAEGAAPGHTGEESSISHADLALLTQHTGSQPEAMPPPGHNVPPGLRGGAASADLSYQQLTDLLGSAEAQEDDLSELDDLSAPSTPRSEGAAITAADAEGVVANAEAAAVNVPDASEQLSGAFSAEEDLGPALGAAYAQGDILLPDQHYSSAGDTDLAETLEQARDEQRLERISQQHVTQNLAADMQRLAVLTGRQGRSVSDAEHEGHMQRLANLTGACTCFPVSLGHCISHYLAHDPYAGHDGTVLR